MKPVARLVLQVAALPLVKRVAKPVARALGTRGLGLLPADMINRTYFSGLCCVDGLPGRRFFMQRDSTSEELATNGSSSFGGEGLRCFAALLPQTRTFLDIGANTGVYSLMAAAHGVPLVHAFEPVPMIHDRLRRNLSINRFRNAHAHQVALTDSAGTITLYVPAGDMPTEASTREGFRPGSRAIEVPAQTVDGFVDAQSISTVDLMKIDTETTEPCVLAGASRTLERSRPIVLCEVLHGLTEDRLHALLDCRDYLYFRITDAGLARVDRIEGDKTYRFLNFLFVPVEKVEHTLVLLRNAFERGMSVVDADVLLAEPTKRRP